jgi:hypothetical protein
VDVSKAAESYTASNHMTVRDILTALRKQDFHAANEGFASVMSVKLAERLAEEKTALANKSVTEDRDMPVYEVQRVFDEIGDVDETELLCGVSQLSVNESGAVVSYVSEAAIESWDKERYDRMVKGLKGPKPWDKKDLNNNTGKRCALCACPTTGKVFGFSVCDYHKTHGEEDPPCPKCTGER